mmetsp:Transcript_20166/g.48944  ORF Transcript_20166/g.48944 Transcript_20166/m.48944 type:complete len:220 (+) Transcript_20166:1701-2360(+)
MGWHRGRDTGSTGLEVTRLSISRRLWMGLLPKRTSRPMSTARPLDRAASTPHNDRQTSGLIDGWIDGVLCVGAEVFAYPRVCVSGVEGFAIFCLRGRAGLALSFFLAAGCRSPVCCVYACDMYGVCERVTFADRQGGRRELLERHACQWLTAFDAWREMNVCARIYEWMPCQWGAGRGLFVAVSAHMSCVSSFSYAWPSPHGAHCCVAMGTFWRRPRLR